MDKLELLLSAKEEIIKHQEEKIELYEQLRVAMEKQIERQRLELAEHRQWYRFAKSEPWHFACWLMFKDVWPFSIWYHRFD